LPDFGHFWPFFGLKSGVNFLGLFFWLKTDYGLTLGKVWGASVMQKTDVFDIINIFSGPFWLILPIFGPTKWGQFVGADFLAKNRLGQYSREDLGLV
jgi:hypothetical protein